MGILKLKGNLIRFDKRGFIIGESRAKNSLNSIIKMPSLKTSIPRLNLTSPRIKFNPPKLFSSPKSRKKPIRTHREENQQTAETFFYRTNKMSGPEKFEDLLETNPNTKPATYKNIVRWKKNPRQSDIEGVDTADIPKAQTLQPPNQSFKRDISRSYRESGGDKLSYKTKDKSFEDTIADEAMFEMEQLKTERVRWDEL